MNNKNELQRGFTIIELMIATLVFSTVLTILTAGVIYFTNMYYKGANLASAQNTARQITENISQAIQFGGNYTQGTNVMCIGNRRYSFEIGKQVSDNPAPTTQGFHGLVIDRQSTCDVSTGRISQFTQQKLPNGTQEFISNRMRLTALSVTRQGASDLYEIQVGIAYGDSDLLTGSGMDTRCANIKGSQYCATAKLVTTVEKRV